jgi:dUTP pyrophosphatase
MRIQILDSSAYQSELSGPGFRPKIQGDAGIDLRAAQTVDVPHNATIAVPLGVAVEISPGHVGWLTGRSSTALSWGCLTHAGIIDSGYRGELHCIMTALTRGVRVNKGERIAQLLVLPIVSFDTKPWIIVDSIDSSTDRGSSGLGSTGRR